MTGVLIGVSDLYVAQLQEDGEYGVPYRLAKAIEVGVAPNVSTSSLQSDDGTSDTDTSKGPTELTIGVRALSTQALAKLLGKKVDAAGGVIESTNDVAPYFAFSFRSLKNNGKYRYVWFYKGKFQEPEASYQTKGETIEYNTPSIVGTFVDNDEGVRSYTLDEDDEGIDLTVVKEWFDAVYIPVPVVGAGA